MISPNPNPPPRIEVEQKTLELARRIVRLSMNENDMAMGLKACAYASILLNRLIAFYEKQSDPLPDHMTEMEEELLTRVFDDISPLVVKKTGEVPLNTIVRQLVQEVNQNRQSRRAQRKPQRHGPPGGGPPGAHKKRVSKQKRHHARRS